MRNLLSSRVAEKEFNVIRCKSIIMQMNTSAQRMSTVNLYISYSEHMYDNNNNNTKSLYFNTQSKRLSLHIKNTTIKLLLLFTSIFSTLKF
jgi:hypothetical protein